MADTRIVERLVRDAAAERAALSMGLQARAANIPPRYFYDALGCALFGAICELPEYYPTRTEHAIFSDNRDAIADAAGRGHQLVDLGAGDCCKALAWLPFLAPTRYLAVDIARQVIADSLAKMAPEYPEIEMLGIVADFVNGLDLEQDLDASGVTFFYPGSSIGNFAPTEALFFLRSIKLHCAGRVEMHLEAMSSQIVRWPGIERTYVAGERIHTENSYKYSPDEFVTLLYNAGFTRIQCWQDARRDFAVFHAA